jgi:hypothetical protein
MHKDQAQSATGAQSRALLYHSGKWVVLVVLAAVVLWILTPLGSAIRDRLPLLGQDKTQSIYRYVLEPGGSLPLGDLTLSVLRIYETGGVARVDYTARVRSESLPLRARGQPLGDFVDFAGYRLSVERIDLGPKPATVIGIERL